MNEIILTTPERLKEIINDCLNEPSLYQSSKEKKTEPVLLYSIKQLSEFLNCSQVTAQKLKNSRKIRFKQFGRKCVFNTAEILEDLNTPRKNGK